MSVRAAFPSSRDSGEGGRVGDAVKWRGWFEGDKVDDDELPSELSSELPSELPNDCEEESGEGARDGGDAVSDAIGD